METETVVRSMTRRVLLILSLLVAAVASIWLVEPAAAGHGTPSFSTSGYRGGNTVVLSRTYYDYAPTIIKDGKYKMWWCGGIDGDHIFYAEADNLQGPWTQFGIVFAPDGSGFDAVHVCDPSIVRVDGVYWMYYSGGVATVPNTQIGAAWSLDGRTWTRANGGNSIVGSVLI